MHRPPAKPSLCTQPAQARLDKAQRTAKSLRELLAASRFGAEFSEVRTLERDADAVLEHVERRCGVLDTLCAVTGPTPAIIEAQQSVAAELDAHIADLREALDAAAVFVSVGTTEAVAELRERTAHVHAIAAAAAELQASAAAASMPVGVPRALRLAAPKTGSER
ncbi:MAG: hypothetical protein ACE37F_09415 [Nannocystaceae bacterium]|nr:hypothetical protein [bacterium]